MSQGSSAAEGRIALPRLVAEVVRHCNLSCRGCNHFAPYGTPRFITPEALARDLGLAALYVQAPDLRISGGEPLLHPDLAAILEVARASGAAERVTLLTNGLLLERMPDSAWRAADRVRISLYPASEDRVDLDGATERARETDTELLVSRPAFREPCADLPPADERLAHRIFRTCLYRRACMTVLDGRLYLCPQSAWAHERWPAADDGAPVNAEDGLLLERRPDMASRIRAHRARRSPLGACSRCLGVVGVPIGHSQLSAVEAGGDGPRRVEELLDEPELAARMHLARLNRRFRIIPLRLRRMLGMLPTSKPLTAEADADREEVRLWPPPDPPCPARRR
jgi:hypothetical protein